MGGCVSSSLVNVFLCHHETTWLNECPTSFNPVPYRCYVDDTFLLCRSHSHIKLFFYYLNAKHDRINFILFDLYFTGLRKKISSAINPSRKLNSVKCLIDRAYKINSNYANFCRELDRLREYFCSNGYSFFTIENIVC